MLSTTLLARQAEALEHVYGHRSGQPHEAGQTGAATERGPTIALARQPGTPAAEIAHEVGVQLGWPVYDRDLLVALARKLDVPLSAVEAHDEQPRGWLLECLNAFAASPSPSVSQSQYVHHLAQLIRELGLHGNCIIVGRGAAQLLPTRSTLRVRIDGHPQDRIAAIRRRCRLDWNAAARHIEETERAWSRFVVDHFEKDPEAAANYDLVLNASHWPVSKCAAFIADAARSFQL